MVHIVWELAVLRHVRVSLAPYQQQHLDLSRLETRSVERWRVGEKGREEGEAGGTPAPRVESRKAREIQEKSRELDDVFRTVGNLLHRHLVL